MYSGWSPFLRAKFWKNELVGRGDERRFGEKKRDGSGRTVASAWGKRYGAEDADRGGVGGGDMVASSGGGSGGEGFEGLGRFLKAFEIVVLTFPLSFFSMFSGEVEGVYYY